ncbi:hypothetical protein J4210_00310 [Candidatus Woesearchaeota archaeon]|nr:hypothetical protein [Candidatus Woesearchaeota archaeon]
MPDRYQELREKYKLRIEKEFGRTANASASPKVSSREYTQFKQELYPARYSFYEKICNLSAKILNLKPDQKKAELMQKNLDVCHLNTTPTGVLSFAVLAGLLVMVFGSLILFALPLLVGSDPLLFLVMFSFIGGLLMIPALLKTPEFLASTWRMKASGQMVQSIFYLVTYLRHTSNLERAVGFAADHLDPPLSLDFRKILWDVETQEYSTIRDSANAYLEFWKDWDREFVEAFHLVESSLYESAEERRLALLDKALDVILNGTYENMLHYAHNLKSPMTMLHMLGIILPILGLVILPLVASFLAGDNPLLTTLYISLIYNVGLPIGVFYLGRTILSRRPAGYGASDISEKENFKHLRNVNLTFSKKIRIGVNPLFFSAFILIFCLLIGFLPLILHALNAEDFAFDAAGNLKMLEYICPPALGATCTEADKIGPYGIGASILSLIVIIGIGAAGGTYYALRSKNVIKLREKTRRLEEEFSSALFQLGNRLGDGLPAELAFGKVAQTMRGTVSGEFFAVAEQNITKLGMGLEQSLFDQRVGAVVTFPSNVIESSMKVLVESIHKGPRIAAQAMLSMSRYIKEIHHVEERLKDLMEEVITSMKAQIKFLTPVIAGIVIGITSMISAILTRLSRDLTTLTTQSAGTGSPLGDMLTIFGIGMPTYYFQLVVGIYIVQIVYILTILSNGIENGADKLAERYELGKNLISSTLLYCLIAGAVMVAFNLFAINILSGINVG